MNEQVHKGNSGCGSSCKHSASSKYYMPRDRMSTVDRIIDDKLFQSPSFFKENNHKNMHAVLDQINQSYKSILT